MTSPRPIHTIAIFSKIQPDTVAAVFILHEFGEKFFPGIAKANVVFWTALPAGKTPEQLESEGTLPIDLGGGTFDHHKHKGESAATLVAKHLGVADDPSLKKLLAYAKRDDLEGKGTISADPLDRAFGLSGLMTTMTRVYNEPDYIFSIVFPLIRAHYLESKMRHEELPAAWRELKNAGKAQEFSVGASRVMVVESDNISLPGFLRAYHHADVVVQRLPEGHTNIITNQKKRPDLSRVVVTLRRTEAAVAGVKKQFTDAELAISGRIAEIPVWFYDTAANTIQNGGIAPQGMPATRLSLAKIIEIVKEGLK